MLLLKNLSNGVMARRLLLLSLFSLVLLMTTGCQSIGGSRVSSNEYDDFVAKPTSERIMQEVKVRWEIREDVAMHCAKNIGMGTEQAYITPPLACAVWNKAKKECTIVTGPRTSHVALGHEIRHCFEGHFHK